jgi:hypothetical protein
MRLCAILSAKSLYKEIKLIRLETVFKRMIVSQDALVGSFSVALLYLGGECIDMPAVQRHML